MAPASNLKLESYSDREILHLLDDLADNDGWALSEHIAQRIGLVAPPGMSDTQRELHARRCVGVRLGWIRRLSNTVEQSDDRKAWRLTKFGQQIVSGKIAANVKNLLEQGSEASLLLALDVVGRRYTKAKPDAANLLRREFAYGTHKNRRVR